MNKRLITDEHIVAYLDGELHVTTDFERDLREDPALAQAASEYAVIGNAFAASSADSRFMLTSHVDASAHKMLANVIKKARKEVRVAAKSPMAAPERLVTAVRNVKYLWAKRAGIGFALAGLAVSLWFNFNKNDQMITQVPVPHQSNVTAPAPTVPTQIQTEVPSSPQYAMETGQKTNVVTATKYISQHIEKNLPANTNNDLAVNTTSQTEAPPPTQEKADPADIMISHRFAKMIKATRAVEVTEQDKVADQM